VSPDGSKLAYRSVEVVAVTEDELPARGEPGTYPRVGPIRIVDIATGDLVTEINLVCEQFLIADEVVPSAGCGNQSAGVEWDLEFSPDGTMLAMADSYTDQVFVWDGSTGAVVGQSQLAGSNARAVAFTPDGQRLAVLFAGGIEHRVRVYGLEGFTVQASVTLRRGITYSEMVFTPDGSLLIAADNNGDVALIETDGWNLLEPIPAHLGRTLDVALNPAGTLIASSGEDGFVRIWNLADRSLVTEIGFEVDEIVNVEFIDDTHLFVTPGFGDEAVVITLDPDELLDVAKSRLIRSFTADECALYGIADCPTLAEIKSG
jgi:WD40 repeat protein